MHTSAPGGCLLWGLLRRIANKRSPGVGMFAAGGSLKGAGSGKGIGLSGFFDVCFFSCCSLLPRASLWGGFAALVSLVTTVATLATRRRALVAGCLVFLSFAPVGVFGLAFAEDVHRRATRRRSDLAAGLLSESPCPPCPCPYWPWLSRGPSEAPVPGPASEACYSGCPRYQLGATCEHPGPPRGPPPGVRGH